MPARRWGLRRRTALRHGSAAALAAATLLLAACDVEPGGEGGGSEGPITVGLLMPTSGTVAAPGRDMLNGWRLYFRLNGEKIAGREVESIHEDTAGDPTTAITKARALAERDGASVLVGPVLASSGYAIADFIDGTSDVVGLNPVTSANDLSQRKRVPAYVAAGGWQSSSPTHVAGDWAADQGYRRAAVICPDYAFGYESCGGFINTFTDRGGVIVKKLFQPLGGGDYAAYLSQIDRDDVDAVFVSAVGADANRFVKAWKDLGFKGKVPLVANEQVLEQSALRSIGSEAPEGLMSFGHYAEGRTDSATEDFVSEYRKAYGETPSYYSCATFAAAQWFDEAVTQLDGDIGDRDELVEALNSVELDNSCLGPLELDEFGGVTGTMYLRKVVRTEEGDLINEVVESYPDIGQFWNYDPQAFLDQSVYDRDYLGEEWPTSCDDFASDCTDQVRKLGEAQ